MSATTSTIAFRVKPAVKRRADRLFSRLGMTTSTGMNILLMQTIEHRGFPFPIVVKEEEEDDEVPNAETRKVLDRVLAGTEPMYGPFNSVDEMFDSILKD